MDRITELEIILIPGTLCDWAAWSPVVGLLPHHGPVRIAEFSRARSIGEAADLVLGRSDHSQPFVVAGLSMGGYVAMEVARRKPEGLQGIALIDTSARADTAAQTAKRQRLIELVERSGVDAVVDELLPAFLSAQHLSGQLANDVRQMARRVGGAAFVRHQKANMARLDSRRSLGGMQEMPTLVVCGEMDRMTPLDWSEEIVKCLGSTARLTIIPGCSHLSTMERPDAIAASMQTWLSHF